MTTTAGDAMRSQLRRLRGRGHWLLLGAVFGGLVGGGIGWAVGERVYRGSVLVEVDPLLPAHDNPAERRTAEQLVEEHLSRQARLLGTLEAAGPRVTVQPLGRPTRTLEAAIVERDPQRVAEALHRLAEAYAAHVAAQQQSLSRRLDRMRDERQSLDDKLQLLHRRIAEAGQSFGAMSRDHLAASRAEELRRVDALLSEARTAAAVAVSPVGRDGDAASADAGTHDGATAWDLDLDALRTLGRSDATLATLVQRLEQVDGELARLRRSMGPGAPRVTAAVAERRQAEAAIRAHLATIATAAVSAPGDAGTPLLLTSAQLDRRIGQLQHRRDQLVDELRSIEERQATLRSLESDANAARADLASVQEQIDRLTLQQLIGGTLSVGEPAVDTAPYRDTRPATALIGAGAGLPLGMLLVALRLVADSRLRRPDAAALDAIGVPLLGAVPALDPSGLDSPGGDAAAMCIHEIRAMMQLRARSHGARAFALTSPSAGAGKTSLTVGLASSLALSGTRTLLVDCDLVRPAKRDTAAGTHRQPAPHDQRQHLDQVMLQMGYLDDADPEMFLLSHDASVGITGLLDGQPLPHCIIETSVPGLCVLPALSASSQHIARLSSAFIRRLIDEALSDFDMVIIDTGPVPGSVEALVATGEADAVILVVPRNESQARFDRAVSYLRVVGAKLAGVVFNRSDVADLTVPLARDAAKRRANADPASEARRSAVARVTGSGLLAAAVHRQSQQSITEGRPTTSRGDARRKRVPPGGSTTAGIDATTIAPATAPTPADARESRPSLADLGDLGDILREDNAPPRGNSQPEARTHDGFPAVDDDLEQALDQLVSGARRPPVSPPAKPARPASPADAIRPPRRRAAGE